MNRVLFLFCALLLIATGVAGQQSRDPLTWQKYTIKGEDFSVSLPTTPEMRVSVDLRPSIQKERAGRHLKTVLDGVTYAIDILENPDNQSLDDLIVEFKATKNFDPASERSVNVNGVAGKEFSAAGAAPAKVQLFATKRRFYRFLTVGRDASSASVQQFFSSITLGDKADGIKVKVGPGMPLETETGERIYKGSEVDKKVRLLESPPPNYPEELRKRVSRGVVVLQTVFSSTGKVVNIQVISPVEGMTEACIAAAEKIRFVPAVKDGKNVSMYMTLEYNLSSM
ncbi:MAG TPA: energy transducer TonB [Pyrinomonadaceae bacterium]|nr:energy transducer TonB [Pyrinomonadaceae bacterium]